MSDIRLIHFAGIHLGFTGPTNLVLTRAENAGAAGRYVREVDIEESVKNDNFAIIKKGWPVSVICKISTITRTFTGSLLFP